MGTVSTMQDEESSGNGCTTVCIYLMPLHCTLEKEEGSRSQVYSIKKIEAEEKVQRDSGRTATLSLFLFLSPACSWQLLAL